MKDEFPILSEFFLDDGEDRVPADRPSNLSEDRVPADRPSTPSEGEARLQATQAAAAPTRPRRPPCHPARPDKPEFQKKSHFRLRDF